MQRGGWVDHVACRGGIAEDAARFPSGGRVQEKMMLRQQAGTPGTASLSASIRCGHLSESGVQDMGVLNYYIPLSRSILYSNDELNSVLANV